MSQILTQPPPQESLRHSVGCSKAPTGLQLQRPSLVRMTQTTGVNRASLGTAQLRRTSPVVGGIHGMQHSTAARIPPNSATVQALLSPSQNHRLFSTATAPCNNTPQHIGSRRALTARSQISSLGTGVEETSVKSAAYPLRAVHYSSPLHRLPTASSTFATKVGIDPVEQGAWMSEFLKRIWPCMAEFMGDKFKAKFKAMGLALDNEVNKFVAKLSATPLTLPMTVEWANKVLEVMWPLLRVAIDQMVHHVVLPKVKAKLPSFLQSMDIDPCSVGHTPPRVIGPIKVVPNANACGGTLVQIDAEYVGDADIEVKYKNRKIGVKEIRFKASFCIEIHGMLPEIPFFKGLSVYMCKPAEFDLKWGGLLEYVNLSLVEEVIKKVVSDIVGAMFLLPNRFGWIYDPSSCNVFEIQKPKPKGCLQITLVRAEGLLGVDTRLDTLWTGEKKSDPFVTIAVGSESWRSTTEWNSTEPEWDGDENRHLFLIDMPEHQQVSIRVWDDGTLQKLKAKTLRIDRGTEGDELARNLVLTIQELLQQPDGSNFNEEILIPERMIALETVLAGVATRGSTSKSQGHGQQEEPGLITKGLSWAKDRLLQGADTQERRARIWLRVQWRPISYSTPVCTTPSTGIASVIPRATHTAVGPQSKQAGSDAGIADGDTDEEDPQPPGGWPTHVLRVGINFVERLLCAADDHVTRFFLTCDATPSTNGDGVNFTDSVDNVTKRTTKKRPALATVSPAHQRRLSTCMDDDEKLKQKIGMMAQLKVPVDTMADVLDVDHAKVRMFMTDATTDLSGRRDVVWDEAFVFYLWDPTVTMLKLEVFKEELKQKPVSVGNTCLQVGALLQQEHFSETIKRLPLFASSGSGMDPFARISLHCQLWPIVTNVPPHLHEHGRDAAATGLPQGADERDVTSLWVLSAHQLRNVDILGGKSDPYCICTIEKGEEKRKLFQTKVVDNDPDPKWDCGPEEVNWTTENLLRFQVYDKDFLKKDDILGECTLSRQECLQGLYTDLTLGDGNGWLRIKVAPMHAGMPAEVSWKEPTLSPSLKLWIHSAQSLKDKRFVGSASGPNPYVLCIMAGQRQFRTKVVTGVDPTWEHGPEIVEIGHSGQLVFEVRDKDAVGARKLGTLYVPREQCLAGMSMASKSLGRGRGTLTLTIEPVQGEPAYVRLEVTIISAKDLRKADLIGHSDPYVVCKLKGKEKFKTDVIWDEPNPVWNHGPVEVLMHMERELRFEVYDKDVFRQGDFLGSAGVDRQVCMHGFEGHLDLGKGNGSLHVSIKAQVQTT